MTTDTSQQTAGEPTPSATAGNGQTPVSNGQEETTAAKDDVLFAANPSAKPTGVVFGIVTLLGLAIVGYLLLTPEALGDPGTTEIGVYVVAFVFVLVAARLLIRIYLLTRFRYVVTEHVLRWEYSLFHYSKSRELPLRKLRGYERTQTRIQSALDVGTVQFLTATNTHGIGYLAFENVADSERLRALIRDQFELERA